MDTAERFRIAEYAGHISSDHAQPTTSRLKRIKKGTSECESGW